MTQRKENLPKVTLKALKGHVHTFSPKCNQLNPYIQLRSVHIDGMKGILAFRYGSLLNTQYKKLPHHYWFYGTMIVFLPKIKFSKWPFFMKIDPKGGKLK